MIENIFEEIANSERWTKETLRKYLVFKRQLTLLSRDLRQLKVGLYFQTWKSRIMVDEGLTDAKVPLDDPISLPGDDKNTKFDCSVITFIEVIFCQWYILDFEFKIALNRPTPYILKHSARMLGLLSEGPNKSFTLL